jgi:2-polyprenyl-3-methyl-5-hydroxy-6-metoxy-1,4-benzoquinol methylase
VTTELDQEKAEAFGGKMVGFLNGASAAMGLSVGHRSGLFDEMADKGPSTSIEVASAAGVNERYAREWLNSMVVAGVVEYNREDETYVLPPEHAAAVTRAAGPGNLAEFCQAFSMLGKVEDELVEVFKNGGGVPYSSFGNFHELMAENSAGRFDHNLIEEQIPLVPGVKVRLETGIEVADLGCGSGHAINLMAGAWPNSSFTGFDFSEGGIAAARAEAAASGLQNASFEIEDVAKLEGAQRYDLITTFDAVHDQADPAAMLANAARLLRPGGTYLCADVAAHTNVADNLDNPFAGFIYNISLFHCMTVSLAQGGAGLGAMWGEEKALEMFAEAGFTNVDIARVDGDPLNNYYVATKD